MIIHIKNITADHSFIKEFLLNIDLQHYLCNKDTYTINDATEKQYQQIVEFSNKLFAVNKIIFVKKNGL